MALSSGVQLVPLSAETTRQSAFTHAAVIPYSTVVSVGGATTTATIAIADLAVGDVVGDRCAYAITDAWTDSDGSMNSITIQVGDGGDTDRYMPATTPQLAEDGTEVDYFHCLGGSTPATSTAPFTYDTADTLDVLFTVAGGANPTCAEITAGKVVIFFQVFNLAKLARGLV